MHKKGFTLVELSIVLVIIGLLIGGILVAQSMIRTAQINKFIQQFSQYDVAFGNFVTNYNQLPGDTNLFDTQGNSFGNNDGIIDTHPSAEYHATWYHLSIGAGLKNNTGVDFRVDPPGAEPWSGYVCPYTGLDNKRVPTCWLIFAEDWGVGSKNYYRNYGSQDVFKPSDALAVDTKIDDGLANSGKMLNGPGSPAGCATAGVYEAYTDDYLCHPGIEVGTWNGGRGN